MDLWIIFFRTILIYFTVFFMLRVMGKREIGKLSVFDLVISIMIAEIAVLVIEDVDKPLLEGILPMVTLVGIQLLFAWLMLKNLSIRRLFDGQPSFIIKNGKLDRREMKRQRYNLSDLMLQLRERNVTNIADVEFAILETTGKLTVVTKSDFERSGPKPEAAGAKRGGGGGSASADVEFAGEIGEPMVDTDVRHRGLPLPLIMDGSVQDQNLAMIGRDRDWLQRQIRRQGFKDCKDVFLCSIDRHGQMYISGK